MLIQQKIDKNHQPVSLFAEPDMFAELEPTQSFDPAKVVKVAKLGFPRAYVEYCLRKGEANYCTAAYYLCGLAQNF